ncbi:hypothetical protein MKW92_024547 [Papaver armeniacum]|nr:hypothetical protein MKW92_024547 [Papaver armeniacum]
MVDLGLLLSWFPCIFLLFFTILFYFNNSTLSLHHLRLLYFQNHTHTDIINGQQRFVCPTNTYVLRYLGGCMVFTAYSENLKHIVKSHFSTTQKGIVTANGDSRKFQRQILSHEFNPMYLRKYVVVKVEIFHRLIPVLSRTAEKNSELDLQDILLRFALDNICMISFGYDPKFAVAFEDANMITGERIGQAIPLVWKLERFLNIGSEKVLKQAITTIREFVRKIIRQKKLEPKEKSSFESTHDLLSRIVKDYNLDEEFFIDIAINFIVGGQDTTSAALTWFFWLVSSNPGVEKEILNEINQIAEEPGYDDIKDMIYIHASLCESMRLYPPVPVESKEAASDDILPDETIIKKGMMVMYSSYAMGRMSNLWGSDWNEFKPERWLERENVTGKLSFVGRDSYAYPIFHAVLRRFRVVPIANGIHFAPVFVSHVISQMKGGFPIIRLKKKTS